MRQFLTLALGVFVSIAGVRIAAHACGGYVGDAASLIESRVPVLREHGQEGLDEAIGALNTIEEQLKTNSNRLNEISSTSGDVNANEVQSLTQSNESLTKLRDTWRDAVDQIGGQRSCTVSKLYWYTDLDKAKAESVRTGRPILSLRMLGMLTDEFSCANSRFFRTSLYSNKEISNVLRDNFVLHWQSVRPVPKVTIDFGDGRKLERTLTGNSAHYVLSSTGEPLDVLPGLYSPSEFSSWLMHARLLYLSYENTVPAERASFLANHHQQLQKGVLIRWNTDVGRLGEAKASALVGRIDGALASARAAGQEAPEAVAKNAVPDAVKAARMAFAKSTTERPMFILANVGGKWLEAGMDDELWQGIANLHRPGVKLDEASVNLMRTEFPKAAQAGVLAAGKWQAEDPILRVVRTFEDSMSLDTVRNEYLLHRRIHEQFAAADPATTDVDKLNEWVYAELFLTPSSDPWLGLAPRDVYTALENGGQIVSATTQSKPTE